MNFFERVPPVDFPDKILSEQERNLTDPPVPFSEKEGPPPSVSPKAAPPSRKTSLFRGKDIVIAATLGVATGISVGSDWSWTHSLTENWKSNGLRGVLETTFADGPKGQQAVKAAPAAAAVTAPDVSEIQNQLNAIARDLSSVQQNINELTAGQEQIRKTQEQLAEAQSQAHSDFIASQAQANAKQNKQPAPAAKEGRKFYRDDYRHIFKFPLPLR